MRSPPISTRPACERGERVAVWLPNRVETVIVVPRLLAQRAMSCNPSLHRNYTAAEIVELIGGIRAAALVAEPGYRRRRRRLRAGDGCRRPCAASTGSCRATARPLRAATPRPFPRPTGPRHACRPPTTIPTRSSISPSPRARPASPRACMHSDNTLLANGRAMVPTGSHDAATVLLSPQPLSHHIATVALEQALAAGCELVVERSAARRDARSTGSSRPAPLRHGRADPRDGHARRGAPARARAARAVRIFYMAGSPIPRESAQEFLDRGITPQNIYGMTENGSHQYTLPSDDARRPSSQPAAAPAGLRDPHLQIRTIPTPRRRPARSARSAGSGGVSDARLFRQSARDRGARSTAPAGS